MKSKITFLYIIFFSKLCLSQLNLIDNTMTRDFVSFDSSNYTYYLSNESGSLNSKLKRIDQIGSTFNVNTSIGTDARKLITFGTEELIFSSKNSLNVRTLFKYNITTNSLTTIDNDIIDVGDELINIDGKVFFLATKNGTNIGMELYVYDGVNVNLVSDINNSFSSSNAREFRKIIYNSTHYLIFTAENINGFRNIYKLDTSLNNGIEQITNLTFVSGTSSPTQLKTLESVGKIAYTMRDNSDGINGFQIWFYNFNSNTNTRITNYNPTTNQGSSPTNLIVKDNFLYFSGTNDGINRNLFSIDVIDNSISLITGILTNMNPLSLIKTENDLFFSSINNNNERVLSYLDSNSIIQEDQQSYYVKNPINFLKKGSQIYFGISNLTSDTQKELYAFDNITNNYTQLSNSFNETFKPFLTIDNILYVQDSTNKLYTFNTLTLNSNSFNNFENISIYPNPVKSSFKLNLKHNFQFQKLEIFDLNGKLVTAFDKIEKNYNISDLNSGFFLVKIYDSNDKKYFLKIIKTND